MASLLTPLDGLCDGAASRKDSDFEIFLDPPGSASWYKELELNANNAVWNLALDKPSALRELREGRRGRTLVKVGLFDLAAVSLLDRMYVVPKT